MKNGRDAIEIAGEQIADTYQEPQSLESIVDYALERPDQYNFAPSDEYLLAAIESAGYRTVIEEGEELERPRFFDDPWNEGEHAVLGNTEILIDFVDDLRDSVHDRGNSDNMYWFIGPTASGKSEMKRCLINGIREFSKTDPGKRYTVAWNTSNINKLRHDPDPEEVGKMYGNANQETNGGSSGGDLWEESPDQTDPLKIFPDNTPEDADSSVRQMIYDEINDRRREQARVELEEELSEDELEDMTEDELEEEIRQRYQPLKDRRGLDPFSQAMYDELFEKYRSDLGYEEEEIGREERKEIFEKIVNDENLQVKDFVVDVGTGIGVLNSEDNEGRRPFKQRMLGSWSSGKLEKYSTGGRKDPRGFDLDGLLPKGSLLTVIEDGYSHREDLKKMHSLPDEHKMEIPGGPDYETYPQVIVISNRDLHEHLHMEDDKYPDSDPNESLLRRMEQYPLFYLTEYGLSTQLIKSEVTGEYIDLLEDSEEREDKLREAVFDDGIEYAPHTMEAAAFYTVLTRIDDENLPGKSSTGKKRHPEFPEGDNGEELSLQEKIELFEHGSITREGVQLFKDDFEFEPGREGKDGVPVTYTAEIMAGLSKEDTGRKDPEYLQIGLDKVITPEDALDALTDENRMGDAAMFDAEKEVKEYCSDEYREVVEDFIYDRLKEDMLDAVLGDLMPPEDEREKYLTNVLRDNEIELNPDNHPELIDDDDKRNQFLKVFETKYLGFEDDLYTGTEPDDEELEAFREEDIGFAYTNVSNRKRDSGENVTWQDIDVLRQRLDELDWDHITNFKEFEGFDEDKWENETNLYFGMDELEETDNDTTKVRTKAHERMIEDFGYSKASAFLSANWTVEQAKDRGEL